LDRIWSKPAPASHGLKNKLAQALYQVADNYVLEDESSNIGRCHLPDMFYARMGPSANGDDRNTCPIAGNIREKSNIKQIETNQNSAMLIQNDATIAKTEEKHRTYNKKCENGNQKQEWQVGEHTHHKTTILEY